MGGPVLESLEGTAAAGDGGEGGDEEGGNGIGAGDDLQGNSSVGVVICEREVGGDRGHAKINIEIPLFGSHAD